MPSIDAGTLAILGIVRSARTNLAFNFFPAI